jgi:NADP-dependent 3-hydroxy acid dehydrogenase YdfG
MSQIAEKVIVITGASSGIGEATARLLASQGARVVLGARRSERLEALAADIRNQGGTAEYRATDVGREEDVQALVDLALERFGRVDVLVNNAGVMPLSPLAALKIGEWNRMIDVNIRGVLPSMQQRRAGQIINVASIGAYKPIATGAVYCATKAAVVSLSEALRQEVGADIRITVVSPGVTKSDLAETISDGATLEMIREFRRDAIPAGAIAEAIAYAIGQPAAVDVSELVIRPTSSAY